MQTLRVHICPGLPLRPSCLQPGRQWESTILNRMKWTAALKTMAKTVAITCTRNWCQSPYNAPWTPSLPVIDCVANTPVRMEPTMPPIPWTPNASSESVVPEFRFYYATMQKHIAEVTAPMQECPCQSRAPAAGVMATRPATAPVHVPIMSASCEYPVNDHPYHGSRCSGYVRDHESIRGNAVGRESASCVEPEPSEPEKCRTHENECHIMRRDRVSGQ